MVLPLAARCTCAIGSFYMSLCACTQHACMNWHRRWRQSPLRAAMNCVRIVARQAKCRRSSAVQFTSNANSCRKFNFSNLFHTILFGILCLYIRIYMYIISLKIKLWIYKWGCASLASRHWLDYSFIIQTSEILLVSTKSIQLLTQCYFARSSECMSMVCMHVCMSMVCFISVSLSFVFELWANC